MKPAKYPAGWDATRVHRVLEHHETQSGEESRADLGHFSFEQVEP